MNYQEILKLKQMLDEAGIPYKYYTDDMFRAKEIYGNKARSPLYPAHCLRLTDDIDVIEHFGSCGNEEDLLEISGALTKSERKCNTICGFLTAEEVFKRFKYCYEHNTSIYCEAEADEFLAKKKTEKEKDDKYYAELKEAEAKFYDAFNRLSYKKCTEGEFGDADVDELLVAYDRMCEIEKKRRMRK